MCIVRGYIRGSANDGYEGAVWKCGKEKKMNPKEPAPSINCYIADENIRRKRADRTKTQAPAHLALVCKVYDDINDILFNIIVV